LVGELSVDGLSVVSPLAAVQGDPVGLADPGVD
jgi:hypothetical protein